ncbi:histone acetyltransferase type B catalytic subunit [Flagelloscypha sp. PMI_526]|nr:histone acetyltransferase type B catalytic subunit [Flagelloscypha sp. PMI_526]
MADWTADSNEALHLALVRSAEDRKSLAEEESQALADFHPTFTVSNEKIYGYKNLPNQCALRMCSCRLHFTSGSLKQLVQVTHSAKLPSSTIDKVEEKLQEVLPTDYTNNSEAFGKMVEDDATSFKPFGRMVYSYTRPNPAVSEKGKGKSVALPKEGLDPKSADAVEFEVWHSTWDTPGFKEYHRRMQIFILLYIEAGSYISEEEDQWEFVVLYEKRKRRANPEVSTYHFVGYSSLYKFYFFPEKVRVRLSQFHKGHGAGLYTAIHQYVLSQPNFGELTVEDPAEAFEDLRDRVDLKMLLTHPQFKDEALGDESHGGGRVGGVGRKGQSGRGNQARGGKIGPPTEKVWAEKWRVQLKLAKRQFDRLIEMLILLRIDPDDHKAMRAYRLQEVLAQLEKEERLEKLSETFENVREGYARILVMLH